MNFKFYFIFFGGGVVFVVTECFKYLKFTMYSLQMQLLLTEKVMYGIPVVVLVDAHSHGEHNTESITVPSLEEGEGKRCNVSKDKLTCRLLISLNILPLSVCSMNLKGNVKECDGKQCCVLRLRLYI